MANMSGIASMLAQSGANIGQQIGAPISAFGQGLGGMLTARREKQREDAAAQEAQNMLKQYANNPAQLNAMGQKYATEGNDALSKVFFDAAKAANRKQVAGLEQAGAEATRAAESARRDALIKAAVQVANNREDKEGAFAIESGLIDPVEYMKQKKQGGSSFRQEVFDPVSGTMQSVNFLTDSEGSVVGRQVLGASKGPEKPTISVKEKDGVFYTFQDGVPVGEYESRGAAEEAAKQENKKNEAILKAQRVKLSIADAIQMIDTKENVGGWRQLMRVLPETEARRFENYLTSIKANVGFDQLLTIKDAGSTLGQVSNIENLLLQSTIDSLDGLMSKEDLKTALNKIDAYYTSLIAKSKFGPDAKLEQWAGSVDWMQPEFVRMYEQQGGEVLVNENEGTILVKSPNGETIKLLR